MASTIKATNIGTPDGTGNITLDRPIAGDGSNLTGLVTPKMKIVRSTYAFSALASASSATQTISGVGFAPDAIYGMWGVGNDTFKGPCLFWAINSSSSLAQSGTINIANFHHNEKMTAGSWRANNNVLRWADGGSDYIGATITTWGSDGITITYTKTGSPTTSQTMNMETAYFKLT